MNKCIIIIFGATGDLTRRKLIPALYRLLAKGKMKNCVIVGAAREKTTSEAILKKAKPFVTSLDEKIWNKFHNLFYYQQLNFLHKADYFKLCGLVNHLEDEYGLSGNRLVYLATAARFFCVITQSLSESEIVIRRKAKDDIWNRLAYEKPFGSNLQSAQDINNCIESYFNEHQIYRVDHFLTKELVGNIALMRFTNMVFEPLWNNAYIDTIEIVLSEDRGIGSRGEYYDRYGALADVTQNHMLELLALVTMDPPKKLNGNYIREKRAKILENISVVDGVLGQYEGYTKEDSVAQGSQTETFASLYLKVNTPRWNTVKFFLKTGKCLDKKETIIRIKFKQVACLLKKEYCPSHPNYIVIRIGPNASFSLILNAKKPGALFEVFPINMDFCHSCIFESQVPDAYETLFDEIIKGEIATSVSLQEIEACWRIIDTVRAMKLPVHLYRRGTVGPEEAMEQFSNKYNVEWQL